MAVDLGLTIEHGSSWDRRKGQDTSWPAAKRLHDLQPGSSFRLQEPAMAILFSVVLIIAREPSRERNND
jgi:hypothetical protein